jgi:hypothetical protein
MRNATMYNTILQQKKHFEHIENFHNKKHFKLNYDEYLISQVFHNDFKPHRLNQDAREIYDEKFWEEKIKCIYEDCHFPIQATERSHIGDLLSGTEFEPTEFQKMILEGMNPIWKYLVILEFRKKHQKYSRRLANFKVNPDKTLTKKGRGWTFIKKKSKNEFDIDRRIPVKFKPRKWIITP